MNINSNTEKLLISFKVFAIVFSNSQKSFHVLASLKILSSLNALNAEIAELEPESCPQMRKVTAISTVETMTTTESKILKASFMQLRIPSARSFSNISKKKMDENIRFMFSKKLIVSSSIGCLSIASTIVFKIMTKEIDGEKKVLLVNHKHPLNTQLFQALLSRL